MICGMPRSTAGRLVVILLSLAPTQSFFFQKPPKPVAVNPLISDLEQLLVDSESGTDQSNLDEIKSLMSTISESRIGDQRQKLPGEWELIFTTEKEVNFFKTSWPFAKVSNITQQIDPYDTCRVDNAINFEGGAAFLVIGSVSPSEGDSEYDRISFEFETAIARVWGRDIELPPVGAGWFDTMFCDDTYRLSQDNRGDWSVFKRL